MPYTISFVIRKRQQIDGLNELSKDKRPDDHLIWDAPQEELEQWLEDVLSNKQQKDVTISLKESDIEG